MLRENNCQLRIIIYDTLLFKNKCQIFFHTKTEILSTSFIKINSKVDALRRKMIPKKGLNTRKNGEQRNWKICRPKNHWTMVTLTCIHPNLPKFNTLIYIYGFLKVHHLTNEETEAHRVFSVNDSSFLSFPLQSEDLSFSYVSISYNWKCTRQVLKNFDLLFTVNRLMDYYYP